MNKVFFIDDDSTTRMICTSIIKKNSFAKEVVTAKNGQYGIDYYDSLLKSSEEEKNNYPELIFLDLNMPVMNGWEFLDEFMKNYLQDFPKTKVLILTSSVDPADQKRSTNYSIVIGFQSKPLTKKMLLDLSKMQ